MALICCSIVRQRLDSGLPRCVRWRPGAIDRARLGIRPERGDDVSLAGRSAGDPFEPLDQRLEHVDLAREGFRRSGASGRPVLGLSWVLNASIALAISRAWFVIKAGSKTLGSADLGLHRRGLLQQWPDDRHDTAQVGQVPGGLGSDVGRISQGVSELVKSRFKLRKREAGSRDSLCFERGEREGRGEVVGRVPERGDVRRKVGWSRGCF